MKVKKTRVSKLEEALQSLRETPHSPANRPEDVRQRMLARIEKIEAEAHWAWAKRWLHAFIRGAKHGVGLAKQKRGKK